MNPLNWPEMKKYCLVYWYQNINQIKKFLDKSMMKEYKENKRIFEVLLWFIILGKQRLLVPLFKLEAGQKKFVMFF